MGRSKGGTMTPEEIETAIYLAGNVDTVLSALLTIEQRVRLSDSKPLMQRAIHLGPGESRASYVRVLARQVSELLKGEALS